MTRTSTPGASRHDRHPRPGPARLPRRRQGRRPRLAGFRHRRPGLLGGHIELLGYPLLTAQAEKIVTAPQRGTANTRWRDFTAVYLLRAQQDVDGTDLATALAKVADHRGVTLTPLSQALTGYAQIGQTRCRAWVQRRDLTDRLPAQFADLLEGVYQFADSALTGNLADRHWAHDALAWR